ncbi:anti-sigma factor [Rhizobium sp. LCM 4573]|uniref:anti-sigma factor family protein n=1 Tax=Rhizobium sp. LCM 4573 TaxID=1848291 RepID=UPI0008DA3786|nr:anti-sigma factor [Rhizobium sp. LCM 4573]OHV76574.1 hypothetical protein LCM4573_13290 [Rhizobium sp. LCM 4573]
MNEEARVSEAELHAYVDGLLDEAERARIETWLAANPDAAAMIADWKTQNDRIRAAFAGHAKSMENDVRLIARGAGSKTAPSAKRLRLAGAAAVIFAIGVLSGHFAPRLLGQPEIQLTYAEILPKEAQSAFLVYAGEVRHPVEVFAEEEAHLATWLGKRLAIDDLKVPNLQRLGFKLVGGRLLPVDGQPGAMFMYEDQAGERLTVLLSRNSQNRTTSFRFASVGDVETFYWIDGELGYAVTGEVPRDMLRQVAEECYRQFPS